MGFSTAMLLGLSGRVKLFLTLVVDVSLLAISVFLSYFIRVGEFIPFFASGSEHVPVNALWMCIVLEFPILVACGLYRMVHRFNDFASLNQLGLAYLLIATVSVAIFTLIGVTGVPRTVGFIQPAVLLILLGSYRLILGAALRAAFRKHQSLSEELAF